jgi:putative phosphoribosyl transferase
MDQPFRDRRDAGRQLARELERFRSKKPIVLGLPRGGVPVAFEVAEHLDAQLDVFVVRKLGVPGHEELAMGAIASGGALILNREVLEFMHIPLPIVEDVAQREAAEVVRRDAMYRDEAPLLRVEGRVVLLVDDGLATGSTMRAALSALRILGPARLIVAVPIAAPDACSALIDIADEVICAHTPEKFRAVGLWYKNFDQTSDDEVKQLLSTNREHFSRSRAASRRAG